MPERRRITSATHNIIFAEDAGAASASIGYLTRKGTKLVMSGPLRGKDIPKRITSPEIISHLMERGFSIVKITLDIFETSHTLLEDRIHDLNETLEDAALYIETRGGRGARAVFEYRLENAAAISYKTIFFGWFDDKGARGIKVGADCHQLEKMELNLVCEPYWRPESATNIVNAETIYNHDDGVANHDNFVDIAAGNILGDVEVPIFLEIEFDVVGTENNIVSAKISRRTRGTVANLVHVYEAENGSTQVFWPDAGGDAGCSNVEKVAQGAGQTTGYTLWDNNVNKADQYGGFRAFARLLTDTIATSKFRISYAVGGVAGKMARITNSWRYLTVANKWQMVDLGPIVMPPCALRTGVSVISVTYTLEYQKVNAAVVWADYLLLLPRDESITEIDVGDSGQALLVGTFFVYDGVGDFRYWATEDAANLYRTPADLRGVYPTLEPNVDNRLIFHITSYDGADRRDEVHGAITDLQLKITINYLPQYLSPLE